MNILLTGGAGYIGSHTAVELLAADHHVVIADNLRNSKRSVIERIEEVSGKSVSFHEVDISKTDLLIDICRSEEIDAVVHFAGLKAVGESVEDPLLYYQLNLSTTLSLLAAMKATEIKKLVFSSSATVYGEPETVPIVESAARGVTTNPYGRTKIMIEQILQDLSSADPSLRISLLRYFNPAGAHPSARMGEDPRGIPNNLIPYLTQVAVGIRDELVIHGDDYPTPDGSCIRDYIHVQDLARGHLAALEQLDEEVGCCPYNLGTGKGSSVLEVVAAFERSTNQHLKRRIGPRRAGDVPSTYCDPTLAAKKLKWTAQLTIEDICRDAWQWQSENPEGYP